MDFIILPDHVAVHELVPDLGGPDFDNLGFHGFDQRQGWNVAALRKGDVVGARDDWNEYSQLVLRDVPPDEIPETGEGLINALVGPFVQTWILFGILQEALGRPVARHEVSRTVTVADRDDGRATSSNYLTVRHLFEEFTQRQDALTADLPRATQLAHCLREAAWILFDLDRAWEYLGSSIVPRSVHLALASLVQTLDHYSILFCQPHLEPVNAYIGRCRAFQADLIEHRGWCPNMIRRIDTDLGLEALYYASRIPGFDPGQAHDQCEDSRCVAFNIDPKTYHTQHDPRFCLCRTVGCEHKDPEDSSCGCERLTLPEADLAGAFDDGGYPLLRFQQAKLEMVKCKPGLSYTAISHVWSDGKGNPHANALPSCQLRSIQQWVTELTKDDAALFWIDTMCVPVREPLRHTAIMRMAQVYREAHQVLVLSQELLAREVPSTPDEALLMIFCSKWMTRLWTMQEAALARELRFQFADYPLNYASLGDEIMEANANVSDVSRLIGARAHIGILHVLEIPVHGESEDRQTKADGVVSLWHGLRYRSTSRLADVAICGSILLGSHLAAVLAAPDESRVQTFWACQKEVPSSLLWANGPRLRVDGFRWAASHLLDPRTIAVPPAGHSPAAMVTPDGLLVEGLPAIWLRDFDLPGGEVDVLRLSLSVPADQGQDQHPNQQRYLVVKGVGVGNETWDELRSIWTRIAVLFLPRLPNSSQAVIATLTMPTRVDDDCLVEIDKEKGKGKENQAFLEAVPARFLAQVIVVQEGGEYDHMMLQEIQGFGTDSDEAVLDITDKPVQDIPEARLAQADQRWRVF